MENCIAKIFTLCLNNRIAHWCEANGKLPEWQARFREGRGCMDDIFTMKNIIRLHLRKDRGKLYGLFIDFTRAFNTVDHQILWMNYEKFG